MEEKYIISIDQSTQGTKALLFNRRGRLIKRADKAHEQIIDERGWISHNPSEIYRNTIEAAGRVIKEAGIEKSAVAGVGICNQRETSLAWDRLTGEPIGNAVVWQCARAAEICSRVEKEGKAEEIQKKTGLRLSPYFPAAKIAWILENVEGAKVKADTGRICHGTIDSWIVFKLTGGRAYKTDYSNASRTQLFNIFELRWDEEICEIFGIDIRNLAEVCDSNAFYGETDFEGLLPKPVPIHSVLGDSHGALFGQGCLKPGMMKATYGTGSSIMMNIGKTPVLSAHGVVTSLAWSMSGEVNYVLEGNLNYTGAVISWLKNELNLITSSAETEDLAEKARKDDTLYLIPAFSGLGAPYWDSHASAAIMGMTRTTGKAEIVRAGIECIAYQITDIIKAMSKEADIHVQELRVDGGPTKNTYLMQFQSDIAEVDVRVPESEELSGIGPAYAAGIELGMWDENVFENLSCRKYRPGMEKAVRDKKYSGWKKSIEAVLTKGELGTGYF